MLLENDMGIRFAGALVEAAIHELRGLEIPAQPRQTILGLLDSARESYARAADELAPQSSRCGPLRPTSVVPTAPVAFAEGENVIAFRPRR